MVVLNADSLRGSYPPLVTPIRDAEVDYAAYERLVEFQIEQGSHGIVVNGTTAEPTTLTIAERIRLTQIAVKVAHGRVPVVAATGSQSHAEAAELTIAAERAGVDAI